MQKSSAVFLLLKELLQESGREMWRIVFHIFICVSSRCRFRAPINSRSPIRRRLTGLPEADKVSTYLPKPYKSATDQ